MVALLHSMDEELPKGSQVTVLNLRPKEEVLGALLSVSCADVSPLSLCVAAMSLACSPTKYKSCGKPARIA